MNTKSKFAAIALLLLPSVMGFLSRQAAADIVIDGYSDAANDRFTNDPGFVMSSFDVSGVGQVGLPDNVTPAQSGIESRWATAISRNVVISANHFRPVYTDPNDSLGETINFYAGNDPGLSPVSRTVTSWLRVGATDIWLGVLNANLPNEIAHYQIADRFLSGSPGVFSSAGDYAGLNAYLFGRSPKSNAVDQDQAVGRNRVTAFIENSGVLGSNSDVLAFDFDQFGDADHVTHEAHFVGGDSGGPTFVEFQNELILLGTNIFVYEDPNTNEVLGSAVNYVGNQKSFIDDFIALNAVPEPGNAMIILLGSLVTARRRRR